MVWDLVKADRDGEILVEVSDAVRESLIEAMDSRELVAAAETLEADELADIAPDLPPSGHRGGGAGAVRWRSASGCARRCPTRRARSAR